MAPLPTDCTSPGQGVGCGYQHPFQYLAGTELMKDSLCCTGHQLGYLSTPKRLYSLLEKWCEISRSFLTLFFGRDVHMAREVFTLTHLYSCPKLKACLPSMTFPLKIWHMIANLLEFFKIMIFLCLHL